MTRQELLSLEHLAVAEVTKFVHIHTEEGYVITPWLEGGDIKEYSGSVCYYMPIREEYPTHRVITTAEHNELEQQRDEEVQKEVEKLKEENKVEE